jgi:hypothetical protein
MLLIRLENARTNAAAGGLRLFVSVKAVRFRTASGDLIQGTGPFPFNTFRRFPIYGERGRCVLPAGAALPVANGGSMVEYVFEQPNPVPDYWGFSGIELANVLLVAESHSGARNALPRAKAMQLFLLWREAINARRGSGEQYEDRVALWWAVVYCLSLCAVDQIIP